MAKKKKLNSKLQIWIEARKRFRLSHAHIQMARELGMNPKKFGGLANHDQEPWKMPLPEFIEHLYFKRFRRERPEQVRSIEEIARHQRQKKAAQKEAKRQVDFIRYGGRDQGASTRRVSASRRDPQDP